MPDRPENPPAFPSGDKAHFPTSTFEPGMSLRDWFAGQALAGFSSLPNTEFTYEGETAKLAYRYADAMLLVRGEQ